MKHGGVGTSGLLTLRDAQTMTTDRHAQVGWPPSRPTGTGSGAAPRRHAARWPAGPRSPARASSWHVIPAAAGAVYREKGEAHAAVAPPACEGTIGGRQERDLRLSALCPIRVQKGLPQARFRWSGPGGATPSGAVSAGSNPVGGTGQRHKFEHSDNLGATKARACDLRKRRHVPDLAPGPPPEAGPQPRKAQLSGEI